jgi:hypothetical protein
MENKWLLVNFIIIILVGIVSAVDFYKLDNISSKVDGLMDNHDFSNYAFNITKSTILVLVRVNNFTIGQQTAGSIYIDSNGVGWKKGTAFSLGDGLFLSASHVLADYNGSNVRIITSDGQTYDNIILGIANDPGHDFVAFATSLNLSGVKIIQKDRAVTGEKVGFVGYPLEEITPLLHDGIISSVRNQPDGFFWYTINSFVNGGNSGGPVFLSDTGEVVGIVSSRQYQNVVVPSIDESKLTAGEKEILKVQMFISSQLMVNSQVGIGQIVGINQQVINNLKQSIQG